MIHWRSMNYCQRRNDKLKSLNTAYIYIKRLISKNSSRISKATSIIWWLVKWLSIIACEQQRMVLNLPTSLKTITLNCIKLRFIFRWFSIFNPLQLDSDSDVIYSNIISHKQIQDAGKDFKIFMKNPSIVSTLSMKNTFVEWIQSNSRGWQNLCQKRIAIVWLPFTTVQISVNVFKWKS